jgi:hypothetical protein
MPSIPNISLQRPKSSLWIRTNTGIPQRVPVSIGPAPFAPINHSLFNLRQNVSAKLIRIRNLMADRARTSGLHQVLLEMINFDAIFHKIQELKEDHLSILDRSLSNLDGEGIARRAFVLKYYVKFFESAVRNEMCLLSEEEMHSIFQRQKPSWVVAAGEVGKGKTRQIFVLFKNGNIMRSRPGIEKIDFRKGSWRVSLSEFSPEEFIQLFFDQIIHDQHASGEENSLYIRCSKKKALDLTEKKISGRIWFSLLHRYASSFENHKTSLASNLNQKLVTKMEEMGLIKQGSEKGNYFWIKSPYEVNIDDPILKENVEKLWRNNSANLVLLRIELKKEKYIELLKKFIEKIYAQQLEGFHKLDKNSDRSFIAKIEKSAPNIAINDLSLLGNFRVISVSK